MSTHSEPGSPAAPIGHGSDQFGKVETRGVDFIPEGERHSRPVDLAWVFFGAQFTYAAFILGALTVVFGLTWWSALSAILVGSLIGSAALGGMALLGPRTGTNGTVSSSAFFGIRGRYVGSLIAQVIDLGFFALVAWSGGIALITASNRLWGTSTGNGALAIGMALAAVVILTIGLLGHATVVANEKFISISNLIIMAIVIGYAASHFHVHAAGPYALSGFWSSWLLGITVAIVNATSYGPFASDYSRYIPSRTPQSATFWSTFGGMFAGNVVALAAGAFIGLSVANPGDPVSGIINLPPTWVMIPVVILGFLGNATNGAMCVYNGTLDLQAILWRLTRLQVGMIFSVVGLAVAYIGVIGYNATDSINALVSIVTVLVTPWMIINIIGYFEHAGAFAPDDLQAYAGRVGRGRYWYTKGVSPRAVTAWVIGVIVGLMFSNTTLYTGPLSNSANGVDLSFTSSAVVAAVIYVLIAAFVPSTRWNTAAHLTEAAPDTGDLGLVDDA